MLFRAIFLEGLCRPRGGIRTVIKHLIQRFKRCGGELRLRAGVSEINHDGEQTLKILLDNGSELQTKQVISSAGWNETIRLCAARQPALAAAAEMNQPTNTTGSSNDSESKHGGQSGKMTFIEAICTLDCQPRELGFADTIVFYNDHPRFNYSQPDDFADVSTGIICSPNNYRYDDGSQGDGSNQRTPEPTEGTLRLTALANYDRWAQLRTGRVSKSKKSMAVANGGRRGAIRPAPRQTHCSARMFTPTTVRHFTSHDNGAVYRAPQNGTINNAPG